MTKLIASIALGVASLGLVAQPAAAQPSSDREIAKAGVFQADDFPAGWRATPRKKSEQGRCPAEKRAEGDIRENRTAIIPSDKFVGLAEQYSSKVLVYRTEEVARRVFKALDSDAWRRCVRRRLKEDTKKALGDQDLKVKAEDRTVTGTGVYGDESSAIGFKVTLSNGSRSQDLFEDFVFARVGRSIGGYDRVGTSESSDFDTPTFDGLITSAVGRLTTATGGQTTTGTTQPG